MATTGKAKKRRLVKKSDNNNTTAKKPKTKNPEKPLLATKQEEPHEDDDLDSDADSSDSSSEDDSESDSEELSSLLEPYSKDQLIELICDAALRDSTLVQRIRDAADRDVSHRKIFVHGLSWDTDRETLVSAFEPFGEIEEANVVMDKNTGKAKGYGFVLFKTRRAAVKSLKNPQKKIRNRVASCQLASLGPAPSTGSGQARAHDATATASAAAAPSRKIYVSNVPADTDPERLKAFFAKFGDIETGPIGFDMQTGKSRGFALFVYKTQEGFRKALQDPYKLFEGHQLHCQKATEGKSKSQQAQSAQPLQSHPQAHAQAQAQAQPPMLAAVAAAQNMALFGQHPGLNPMYGGFLANPTTGMIPGSVNPAAMVAGTLNQGVIPTSQVAQAGAGVAGLGGYSGGSHGLGSLGGGSSSVLGAYGSNAAAAPPASLQALQQVYPNSQFGQTASGRVQGTGASITGYPSYMWYDTF